MNLTFFRDNKLLLVWGAVAFAIAFSAFNKPGCNKTTQLAPKPDTLIYFNYTSQQQDQIDELLNTYHQKLGFNGTVLIGQKDSVFYARSFGYRNFAEKDTLNLQTAFQLASVSKQFTAVAILQLYEKGLLKLNDSIEHFYPEFPIKGITIHHLLTHRSGLPNYHYFLQHIPTTYDTLVNNQQVVQEISDKKLNPYFKPNRRYLYSNTGYAVLAAIVEKVSKMPFNNYVDTYIFKPLQMNNSFVYSGKSTQKNANTATGYLYKWRVDEDNYLDGVTGDKGIYSSTSDLFKWDQGLYKNIIINTDTLALAFEPLGKPAHFKSNYGYGWRMFYWGNDSLKVLFHGGWWHGFRTLLIRIPSDSTTVVVLKNRSKGAQMSTKKILNILYPDSLPVNDTVEYHIIEEAADN